MTRRIHVRLDYAAKAWVVSHYVEDPAAEGGYSADPEVFDLFGTETLPTPFTLQADERTVLAELRRLNPEAVVERI
jgi:hypothetical protein